jgi:hypothetical protein
VVFSALCGGVMARRNWQKKHFNLALQKENKAALNSGRNNDPSEQSKRA